MTTNERITVECFAERVENFITQYKILQESKNDNYYTYESRVFDLIFELEKDIKDNEKNN